MNNSLRGSLMLCILLIAVQGFSLVEVISRGNHDFIINIVCSTIFWLFYTVIEYIYQISVNFYIRLAVVLSIIGDGFCGFYLNLYVISATFDRIQHILGTFAIALFFYAILTNFMHETISKPWIRFIFVAALGMAVGSINEIVEYATDTIMKPQILNQPSLEDTDLDLISNAIGSILAGFYSMYKNLTK